MIAINYYLGIDGGGTNSKAYLSDQNANILASAKGPSTNYQVIGINNFENYLNKTINILLTKSNLKRGNIKIKKACLGLAGIDTKNDYNRILPLIEKNTFIDNVILLNDSELALIGANASESGIILISGTGSIALGKDKFAYKHEQTMVDSGF